MIALWEACGLTRPWNRPGKDIAFARSKEQSDVLVGVIGAEVVASIMVGHDGHRGSFYYVAVAHPSTKAMASARSSSAKARNG